MSSVHVKKAMTFILAMLLIVALGGCNFLKIEQALSKEDARNLALTCFEEHQTDMEAITQSDTAYGETKWCKVYSSSSSQCEFVLHQTGFTGTNTRTGIVYIPTDTPDSTYTQDENNPDVYSYENNLDQYILERIEKNWFFFYYEYDF